MAGDSASATTFLGDRYWTEDARLKIMATRQSELLRVLGMLSDDLPDPAWVALVDHQGLVVACVLESPEVEEDRVSAMTAALVTMSERVLLEVEGGQLRYASVAGSRRQYLIVILSKDYLLSIGLRPDVPAQSTFRPLTQWVPEIMRALQKRFA